MAVHMEVKAPAKWGPASKITNLGSPLGTKKWEKAALAMESESALVRKAASANAVIQSKQVSTLM